MSEHTKVSLKKHGYYRAVLVPAMRKHVGFESDADAHRHNKAAFYGMSMEDPNLPSMASMTDEEAGRFLAYVTREAAEMGLVMRDPSKDHSEMPDSPYIWPEVMV